MNRSTPEPYHFVPGSAAAGSKVLRRPVRRFSPISFSGLETRSWPIWSYGILGPPAAGGRPLAWAGCIDLPERLLADYRLDRSTRTDNRSELGRVLVAARHLAEQVDRVVVLAAQRDLGGRIAVEACCHPLHDVLSRADRGGQPRVAFDGFDFDNDARAGLLDLVGRAASGGGIDDHTGLVVIATEGWALETAVALRQFLAVISSQNAIRSERLGSLVIPVVGGEARLGEIARTLECPEVFRDDDGITGPFAVFTPAGLLPAALAGLDVVGLLAGAEAMTTRFRDEPPGNNPVLDFVAQARAFDAAGGRAVSTLALAARGLRSLVAWHAQLRAEAPAPADGTARKVIETRLVVDHPRREPLVVGPSVFGFDGLEGIEDRTLTQLAEKARLEQGVQRSHAGPEIHLPRLDPASVGQLLQMLLLATAVDARWDDAAAAKALGGAS